jgi:hypothetical protein
MTADATRTSGCDPLVLRRLTALRDDLGSWRAVASYFEVTPAFISNITSGYSRPTDAICRDLGLERRVRKTVSYTYVEVRP